MSLMYPLISVLGVEAGESREAAESSPEVFHVVNEEATEVSEVGPAKCAGRSICKHENTGVGRVNGVAYYMAIPWSVWVCEINIQNQPVPTSTPQKVQHCSLTPITASKAI